jgi:FHA domain
MLLRATEVSLALRFRGHRCTDDSLIKPWYFAGSLELTVGQEFPIPPEGLVLGRGAGADVRVASNGVARKHTRLEWSEEGVLVAEDLRSTNGTQVNGVQQEQSRLCCGDLLTLAGFFDFEVVEVD